MTKPLKILFLLQDLCFGGTQRQTLELARRLDRNLFSPSMLTLTGKTDLDQVAVEADITVRHLGVSRRVAPLFFLNLRNAIREAAPDILVPCTALPNIWGRIWGRYLRVPVIIGTCRGGSALACQHEALLWRLTHHMICNSTELYIKLQRLGVPATRLTYIANGVDSALFMPAPVPLSGREPVILCVARLVEDKNHHTLLRAFKEVLQSIPEARLRLVGDGPEEANLRRWVGEHGMSGSVDFFPGGTDMRPHYAQARVFALSSVREGQPNVILEAMACGLPVCATSVGGIPDMVEENITGFLSPAKDHAGLGHNCVRLLADARRCESMGGAGRIRVEREFSFGAMVEAHQQLFTRLWEAG
ncbi:MAG: glycosyltransferase [Desulfovibrio sp.]|jgi:glycosyltransferase involved in cell wall biosynthesis|nr:glycosyltransferase [Desulfovibrio sp.]